MTDKPTDEALENLFVEETGFDPDDFPAAIFSFARAVLEKWGTPAPVGVEPLIPFRHGCKWCGKTTGCKHTQTQAGSKEKSND